MAHQIEDSGERNTTCTVDPSTLQVAAPRKVGRPKGQKKLTTKYEKKSNFIGTWNSFPVNYLEVFKNEFTDFVCQEEIGLSGNHHVQFAGRTESKRSITAMAKRLKGAHLEFADNWIACLNYCSKQDTCIAGTHFEHGNAFEKRVEKEEKNKVIDPLEGKELYIWQEEVIKIISGPVDDRKIYAYYEGEGNTGKTSLAKHCYLKYPGCLYLTGKTADMKYTIAECIDNGEPVKCVFLDYTRCQEDYISYQGIEEIKNGILFSTKYKSKQVVFNPPHIIIFSNYKLDYTKLSADRWISRNIEYETSRNETVPNAEQIEEDLDNIYLDLMMKISQNERLTMDQWTIVRYYENMLKLCYEPYYLAL